MTAPRRPEPDVLRVFCDAKGGHGNELGVVRDGSAVPSRAQRQEYAAQLGFSETVFVDDPERGVVDIYTPGVPLPFAGHPLVGCAWLLDLPELLPAVGPVDARFDGEFAWITADPDWAADRVPVRYGSVAEVEALPVPEPGHGWQYAWAFEDEAAGRVRARGFPGRVDERGAGGSGGAGARRGGSGEDEATGSAALALSHALGRALNITQGRGSQILTAPGPDGRVEIGGRVRLVSAGGWTQAPPCE
ncbi:PhzF family phenazine biosynthesis protein [Streptomyces sp. NPDC007088]|uniref:PhzF family phenazine biosynthesis protein n=1 Tax=Streptomyces sp. NPDC007088 TaxID=3364773 RepID=UPI0036B7C711